MSPSRIEVISRWLHSFLRSDNRSISISLRISCTQREDLWNISIIGSTILNWRGWEKTCLRLRLSPKWAPLWTVQQLRQFILCEFYSTTRFTTCFMLDCSRNEGTLPQINKSLPSWNELLYRTTTCQFVSGCHSLRRKLATFIGIEVRCFGHNRWMSQNKNIS